MTESSPSPMHVTLTRVFDAPIDLVFRAWTEREQVERWMKCEPSVEVAYEGWAPEAGTAFRSVMRKPGEWEVSGTGRIVEVDPPRLLVYVNDANPSMQMPETTIRIVLEEVDSGTRLTLTHSGLPNEGMCGIVEGGWTNSLTQLGELVAVAR